VQIVYSLFGNDKGLIMEVDNGNKPKRSSNPVSHVPNNAVKKPHRPDRSADPQTADPVHLSSHAKTYQDARKKLSTLPDVDADKVREIRERLASGRYRLDPALIAEKMIKDALTNDD
jgi:negative regulator of flagellin synthesis FlgM